MHYILKDNTCNGLHVIHFTIHVKKKLISLKLSELINYYIMLALNVVFNNKAIGLRYGLLLLK